MTINILWLLVITIIGLVVFFKNRFMVIVLVGLICFSFGILRYESSLVVANKQTVWFYNETALTTRAVIVAQPDVRIDHVKLTVESVGKMTGKILLKTNLYPEYQYGDLLEINCRLKTPEAFDGFAYDRFLAKDGIYSVCYYPEITLLAHGFGDFLLEKIFLFKRQLQQSISANLPEPHASFLAALLLGTRQGLPEELLDRFSLTGTIHIISISGLHITILSTLAIRFLLAIYISRRKAFSVVTIVLIGYLILIGFPSAALRAGVMGWLALLALHSGRVNQSANTIIFAATVMLLINPKILRDDVGFQLSCAAMLGLIYFSAVIERRLKKIPKQFGVRESVAMTLSAQMTTAPLVMAHFGNFSFVAPVVNILITPVLPAVMIGGFAGLGVSGVVPTLTTYAYWPVLFLLQYVIGVVNFFGELFFAGFRL
ncbi:MAG: ComEC/Rec2 family competence protein [Candidatus Buchananbacteria bacterium]|nr:ComEC/Rec2 family competence protein [Candidatus Buchananbacteria bacterium]